MDAVELPGRAELMRDGSGWVDRVARQSTQASSRGIEIMPRRPPRPRKAVPSRQQPASALRQALTRRKKAELVDVLVELADADRGIHWQLTARFDVATTPDEVVTATRRAIADATDFDERQINRNFDYDDDAYSEVKRNLGRLIDWGQLRQAMELSLELMKQGSYQVEMSDEGLMAQDIDDCLSVVIAGLRTCDLPAAEVIAWCSTMIEKDRVGFIARKPVEALRTHWQRTEAG
jgi:uncharacterized Zn finger protein